MKIRPLGDRVLVSPVDVSELSKGGVVIPLRLRDSQEEGTVIAVGNGLFNAEGTVTPMEAKAGDHILMPKAGGTVLKSGDDEYRIIRDEDILAIIG